MGKTFRTAIIMAATLMLFTAGAFSETRLDAYFGMGSATVGSSNDSIDFFDSGIGLGTPSMDGVFGTFGAGLMLNSNFGFGGAGCHPVHEGRLCGTGLSSRVL